jgi:hypothetical protein
MWDPRRLTTLWAFTTCYRYSFTFYLIYLSMYSSAVLVLDFGRFFRFLILYTASRTPWAGDQRVARPLPKHRVNTHRHPCLEWDSNPRSSVRAGENSSCLRPRGGHCNRDNNSRLYEKRVLCEQSLLCKYITIKSV